MTTKAPLAFVHAHPDDEAFFGAGACAHYRALGHRVVLVTCTNGGLGLDPVGRPGDHPDHDHAATRATRARELQSAASLLGFSRVVTLGYDDSGMTGWASNENPYAFVNADEVAVARTLASIFDEEGVRVVVTYDERGFYGHPDHVKANLVTRRALESAPGVRRLYYPVVPRRVLGDFVKDATELGLELPAWVLEAGTHVADDDVATTLDVTRYAALKQRAMAAHESQVDNGDVVRMNERLFARLFGVEYYQRAHGPGDLDQDRVDLMGGVA